MTSAAPVHNARARRFWPLFGGSRRARPWNESCYTKMRRHSFGVEIGVLCVMAAVLTYGYQSSPANRPWPPGVQQGPEDAPALPAAEALKTFYMQPGYHLGLV